MLAGAAESLHAALYRLGTSLFIDRLLLEAPADWRAALAEARRWTPPDCRSAAPMRWRSA